MTIYKDPDHTYQANESRFPFKAPKFDQNEFIGYVNSKDDNDCTETVMISSQEVL